MNVQGKLGEQDTQAAILDAAERLIATHQYATISLRDIAAEAQSNLGLLYYYWKTKEKLFAATVERRVRPIVEMRIKSYLDLRGAYPEKSPEAVPALMRAFLEPVMIAEDGSQNYARDLMRSLYVDPSPEMQALRERWHQDEHRILFHLCRFYCYHLSEQELFWRMQPVFASICYATVYDWHDMGPDWRDLGDMPILPGHTDHGVAQFVQFLSANLLAPSSSPGHGNGR